MPVRIENNGPVRTVIHSRAAARNAMDPASADALTQAFLDFEADDTASVAVLWGEGGAFVPVGTSNMSPKSRLKSWNKN